MRGGDGAKKGGGGGGGGSGGKAKRPGLSKAEQKAALDAKEKVAKAKADAKLKQIKEDREVAAAAAAAAKPGASLPPSAQPPPPGTESAVGEVKSKISPASFATLPAPLAELLASPDFASQCAQSFEELDVDKSGVLEPQEAAPPIVAILQSIPIAGPPPTVQQCLIMIASEFDQVSGWGVPCYDVLLLPLTSSYFLLLLVSPARL